MQRPQKIQRVPDQEEIYQLLVKEDWVHLLSFVWQNPNLIASDEIIRHAINTCETVFFSGLAKEKDGEKLLSTLETFYMLHTERKHRLSEERFKVLIHEIVKIWKEKNLEQAYLRAKKYPDDELCQLVIKQYEATLPKRVAHSQSSSIQVIENKNISTVDGRRTLFKAPQEKEFFDAVRDAFPLFTVYPNVALSSVISFDAVKHHLSNPEQNYFFMAIVDCVVFDYHHDLYLPKFFFELDSSYHDEVEQIRKDEYKNNIFSAAGQKLYRIRRTGGKQNRGDFAQLIRDLEKELSPLR